MFDPKTLTWACHICGDVRPDAQISVLNKPLFFHNAVVGSENVRYCNDRAACLEGAKSFSHFKQETDDAG